MTKILIAEDNRQLNEGIKLSLREAGREFLQSYTLSQARRAIAEEKPDLAILDINFPDGSGLELLKEIKSKHGRVRVILLTANNMETDIVIGLESGADDYITKPFSLSVLRARVNVQLRKEDHLKDAGDIDAGEEYRGLIIEGALFFDFDKMIFHVGDRPIELSKTEQKLLRILVDNKGKIVTRELLIDRIWDGDSEYVDGHALTVTIKRLRDKLGENPAGAQHIKTVYGIGYSFV